MSRPARYIIPATLVAISALFTGCKTIYSDMYSPRRNHFVPVKEKPKPEPAPIIDTTPATSTEPPSLGLPPAAPSSAPAPAMPDAGAAPAIPGLQ